MAYKRRKTRVLVLGGTGLAGSAFKRYYEADKTHEVYAPTRQELDLSRGHYDVLQYMSSNKIDIVIMAAAYVGGILANSAKQYTFLQQNLSVQGNVIEAFRLYQENYNTLAKFLFMGSTCIYPRIAQSFAKEENFLQGPLEPSNEGYAIAKIAGIRMAQQLPNTYCVMPCNLYGPNDTYDLFKSHVIPAIILKAIQTRKDNAEFIYIGGLGHGVKRQFMFVDDLVRACDELMTKYDSIDLVNIGPSSSLGIDDLTRVILQIVNPDVIARVDEDIPVGVKIKEASNAKLRQLLPGFEFTKINQGLWKTFETCPKLYELLKGVWIDKLTYN